MPTDDLAEYCLLAAVGYCCFAYYEVVGRLAGARGVDFGPLLRTPLDGAIPYWPVFVLPYALAFVLPLAVAVAVARHGGLPAFRRVFFVYLGLLVAHFMFYLALPTSASGIMLKETGLGTGVLGLAVRFFYRLAPPWNAFPSFHVGGGWFFYRVLARWAPRAGAAYLVWFLLMTFGTAAIKIHWVLDGLGGWLAAELAYRFVLLPLEARGFGEWNWPSLERRVAAHALPLLVLGAGLAYSLLHG